MVAEVVADLVVVDWIVGNLVMVDGMVVGRVVLGRMRADWIVDWVVVFKAGVVLEENMVVVTTVDGCMVIVMEMGEELVDEGWVDRE